LRENVWEILSFEAGSAIAQYAFLSLITANELATDCWEVSETEHLAVLIRISGRLSPKDIRILVQEC
jgi:hypothetical protein